GLADLRGRTRTVEEREDLTFLHPVADVDADADETSLRLKANVGIAPRFERSGKIHSRNPCGRGRPHDLLRLLDLLLLLSKRTLLGHRTFPGDGLLHANAEETEKADTDRKREDEANACASLSHRRSRRRAW